MVMIIMDSIIQIAIRVMLQKAYLLRMKKESQNFLCLIPSSITQAQVHWHQ